MEEAWGLEDAKKKRGDDRAGLTTPATMFLEHYRRDFCRESVTMVRIAELVAVRLLDLIDIWDLFKVLVRAALYTSPEYGHTIDRWDSITRPCRWGVVPEGCSDEEFFGFFEKISLVWHDRDGDYM